MIPGSLLSSGRGIATIAAFCDAFALRWQRLLLGCRDRLVPPPREYALACCPPLFACSTARSRRALYFGSLCWWTYGASMKRLCLVRGSCGSMSLLRRCLSVAHSTHSISTMLAHFIPASARRLHCTASDAHAAEPQELVPARLSHDPHCSVGKPIKKK